MATQEIYVLNKRLKLLHSEKGFKTSMDSVLLAAACQAKAGDHILDMGCGVGGAGFCVLTRVKGVKLTGVEIQQDHAKLAQHNAVINMLQDRSDFVVAVNSAEAVRRGLLHSSLAVKAKTPRRLGQTDCQKVSKYY